MLQDEETEIVFRNTNTTNMEVENIVNCNDNGTIQENSDFKISMMDKGILIDKENSLQNQNDEEEYVIQKIEYCGNGTIFEHSDLPSSKQLTNTVISSQNDDNTSKDFYDKDNNLLQNGDNCEIETILQKTNNTSNERIMKLQTIGSTQDDDNTDKNDLNDDQQVDDGGGRTICMKIVTKPCYVLLNRAKIPVQHRKVLSEYSNNISDEFIEHMKSVRVSLKKSKYHACRQCSRAFFAAGALKKHSAAHTSPVTADGAGGDRFVKRFKCEECAAKFVLISTLEAHSEVHRPLPHACSCGVAFRRAPDLRAHARLVHGAALAAAAAAPGLTLRQRRALQHAMWAPVTSYRPRAPPDPASEPAPDAASSDAASSAASSGGEDADSEEEYGRRRARPRPRLRAQLVVKRERAPRPRVRVTVESEYAACEPDAAGRFPCPTCGKTFASRHNLKVHSVVHTGARPYPCELCGKSFTQAASLSLHVRRHAGVRDFRCDFCPKAFPDKHALANHRRTHTGEKPFACSHCDRAFADPSALIRHERIHTGVKPYACAYCPKRFSDASQLIVHRKRHERKKDFPCEICQKSFYIKPDRTKHMATVHGTQKKFTCHICSKKFALKSYLYIHMKSHGPAEWYECDHCGKRTNYKGHLVKHIQNIHMSGYRCKKCRQTFLGRVAYLRHQAEVHGRAKYECNDCGKKFTARSNIQNHIKSCHDPQCPTCKLRYPSEVTLQAHILQGCIQCKCGKYFQNKKILKEHQKEHFENENKCWCCRVRFESKKELDKHFKENHSDKIEFECNDCGGIFVSRDRLINHIFKIHFIMLLCNICKHRFRSSSDLQLHKKVCLPKKRVQCDICEMYLYPKSMNHHLRIHA